MEFLSHDIHLDDACTIVCPLCGSRIRGLGRAAGSGCPHLAVVSLCRGGLETFRVEDLGMGEDLPETVREKAAIRALLEGGSPDEILREDLVEAYAFLSLLATHSVLMEFRLRTGEEEAPGTVLWHGLFVLEDPLELETFLREVKVEVEPGAARRTGLPSLLQVLSTVLALPLWLSGRIAPSLHRRIMAGMERRYGRAGMLSAWESPGS